MMQNVALNSDVPTLNGGKNCKHWEFAATLGSETDQWTNGGQETIKDMEELLDTLPGSPQGLQRRVALIRPLIFMWESHEKKGME